jgi:hypothetical protein
MVIRVYMEVLICFGIFQKLLQIIYKLAGLFCC